MRYLSVLFVTGWERVVAGGDGVGIPPLAFPVLNADFTAAEVVNNLLGAGFGFLLGGVDAACAVSTGAFNGPAVRVFGDITIIL